MSLHITIFVWSSMILIMHFFSKLHTTRKFILLVLGHLLKYNASTLYCLFCSSITLSLSSTITHSTPDPKKFGWLQNNFCLQIRPIIIQKLCKIHNLRIPTERIPSIVIIKSFIAKFIQHSRFRRGKWQIPKSGL